MAFWKAPAALVLLALVAPASAQADGKPYFDATRGDRPARERTPAQTLTKRLGAQAVVDVDSATGTPRVLGRLNGTLTAPSSGSATEIADAYVRSHLSDLGLTSADLDTLSEPSAATSPSGLTEVSYEQSVDGIPSANSGLRVNVTRDGRVLNVMGSPAHAMDVDSTTPSLDAGEAIRAVQDDLGAYRSLPKTKGPSGPTQSTTFQGDTSASLELLQRADGTALVWHVYYDAAPGEFYDATVDARTGKVLKRANMTKSISNGLVWERYAMTGAQRLVDIGKAGAWLSNAATTLNGPFVHAWSDLDDGDDVDAGEEVDRTGGGDFAFTFQGINTGSCSDTHACSWSGGNTWTTNRAQTTVQAFYYANKFHDHLAAAPIGFNGFENGDKLLLQTDDGADPPGASTTPDANHRNNANMSTLPEGQSPTMQMYLFTGQGFRNISGSDDAAIVYHEYTHGLSNRLITSTPNGPGALNSPQAGAMGEAWSDWYAMDFLVDEGQATDTGADGELDMGEGTDLVPHNLRTEPIDCPVGSIAAACAGTVVNQHGGYTYGNFGGIARGPEVHSDGEIWVQTLWDLRNALGSTLAEQLITDGMRITPPEPSFLDARNAIVQADINLGGQQLTQIWAVFAHRGMGYFAGTFDGSDTSPTEDSSPPPPANAPKGSITGKVTDADTGAAIANAKVGIAGLTSGLFNFSATTDANGNYSIAGVPEGSYPRLNFSAGGYDATWRGPDGAAGHLDPRVVVLGGQTTSRSVVLRRNWVSLNGGVAYDSNHFEYENIGCGPEQALDQSLGTGWSSDIPASSVDDPFLIVKLPSSTALTLTSFAADPGAACGDRLENATAQLKVETSTTTSSTCNTGSWAPARTMSFGAGAGGTLNEFNPDSGPVAARCVRVTLLRAIDENAASFRDLSEFGVYTTPPPAQPAAVNPTPTPMPLPTPTPVATPVPTATPTPPPPVKPVTFKLPTKGSKGAASVSVSCPAECTATATLTANRATAKKLKLTTLGKAGKAGKGTLKFTVKLSSKARKALKKHHLKSVTVTLKVSVRLNGKTTTSSRRVKIKV